MRVYIIKGDVLGYTHEKALQFVGTLANANGAMKHYNRHPEIFSSVYMEQEDIPMDKYGLLEWLNQFTLGSPMLD